MTRLIRNTLSATFVAGLVASPALAHDHHHHGYDDHEYYRHHYHHRHHSGFGEFVGGAAVGALASEAIDGGHGDGVGTFVGGAAAGALLDEALN